MGVVSIDNLVLVVAVILIAHCQQVQILCSFFMDNEAVAIDSFDVLHRRGITCDGGLGLN